MVDHPLTDRARFHLHIKDIPVHILGLNWQESIALCRTLHISERQGDNSSPSATFSPQPWTKDVSHCKVCLVFQQGSGQQPVDLIVSAMLTHLDPNVT